MMKQVEGGDKGGNAGAETAEIKQYGCGSLDGCVDFLRKFKEFLQKTLISH
jgi:hypothetical protein